MISENSEVISVVYGFRPQPFQTPVLTVDHCVINHRLTA